MVLTLPPLTRKRRIPAMVFIAIFIGVLYQFPIQVRIFQASPLWPTAVDRAIPFIDWTIWVYCSYYVFLFLPFAVCRDNVRAARALYGLMANSILGGLIFLAWPTAGVVQHPELEGLSGLLWSGLLSADRPTNYFPSLHVANACICVFALGREKNAWRYVAPLWTFLIIVSTVTTKQHFFIDLPAGMVLAAFNFWLVRKGVRVEQRPKRHRQALSAR